MDVRSRVGVGVECRTLRTVHIQLSGFLSFTPSRCDDDSMHRLADVFGGMTAIWWLLWRQPGGGHLWGTPVTHAVYWPLVQQFVPFWNHFHLWKIIVNEKFMFSFEKFLFVKFFRLSKIFVCEKKIVCEIFSFLSKILVSKIFVCRLSKISVYIFAFHLWNIMQHCRPLVNNFGL